MLVIYFRVKPRVGEKLIAFSVIIFFLPFPLHPSNVGVLGLGFFFGVAQGGRQEESSLATGPGGLKADLNQIDKVYKVEYF